MAALPPGFIAGFRSPPSSQAAIDYSQTPLTPKPQPVDLLHPPAHLRAPSLLLANAYEQPSDHARILPDTVALESLQQVYGSGLSVRVRRGEAGHEDGEGDFAAIELASGEDVGGEGEDVRDSHRGIGGEGALVCNGDESLAWEH